MKIFALKSASVCCLRHSVMPRLCRPSPPRATGPAMPSRSPKNADGSVAVQFGACDGKIPNCLPITNGWNYMVRLYRPRTAILNDTWNFRRRSR